MKPPRKPTNRRPGAPRPGSQARTTPLSPRERAKRVADSWGVSSDEPAPTRKQNGASSKGNASAASARGEGRPKLSSRRDGFAQEQRQRGERGDRAEARRAGGRQAERDKERPAGRDMERGAGRSAERSAARKSKPSDGFASPARAYGDDRRAGRGQQARPDQQESRQSRLSPKRPFAKNTSPARGDSPRANAPRSTATPHRAKASGEPQRIAKLLARAGIASRREIERMIAEGRIALNGVPLDTPATILPSLKGITVDGAPVAEAEGARLFLFHKPAGCLTTERDPAGRPTIYDRLPKDLPRLMPVGRLDMTTEGLLLLTNDGELKRRLELPSSGIERTYRARAFGEISQSELESLIEGVEVEGIRYGRIDANLERRTGRNQWIEMTLTEGKNREVRRVLEYLGLKVNRLIRTRYGPFELGESNPGALIEIKRGELDRFLHILKGLTGGKAPDAEAAEDTQ